MPTAATAIRIRPIEEADLEPLLEAERLFNTVELDDPDFGGVVWLNPWTLSAADVLAIIRQYPSEARNRGDTRTLVAEVKLEATEPDGSVRFVPFLCGGFAYEILPDEYLVRYIILHPAADRAGVLASFLDHLKKRSVKSGKSRRILLYLRDRDEAGFRQLMPVVQAEGFAVTLRPDHFGSHDGWECLWETPSSPD
jgi:hypothetical protein